MATPKKPTFTSPKGVFLFPSITKPDYGNDQFPKPAGEFKTQLVLSREAAQPMIDKLQPLYDEAIAEGEDKFSKLKIEQRKKLKSFTANELFQEEYDKVTEEPTGNVIFKFATVASGVNAKGDAWTRKIPVFDAKGKPLAKPPAIWGGTIGKVSFEASAYFIPGTGAGGLKLYLTAAQIIELRSAGQRDASGYGFGEEEGFSGEDAQDEGGFGDETGGSEGSTSDGSEDF